MVEQHSVNQDIRARLRSAFGADLKVGVSMVPYTSYRTGGEARYFLLAKTSETVAQAIKVAHDCELPYFLLGGGSNVLVSDTGFDGLVIKVDVDGIAVDSEAQVDCGAGEQLSSLVDFAVDKSLTGMEFAAGIWGSVGGAVCGNAGAYGSDMSQVVQTVTVVDESGEMKTLSADQCGFAYRYSRFKKSREVIVRARFSLAPGDKAVVSNRVKDILKSRSEKHPVDGMSAGCFFKNVPDQTQPHGKLAAGKLLDEAGAKELSVGGAKVFEKHANIIVNTGKATSKDIRQLADIMKQKVKKKFGVDLEEEVVSLGEF